MPVDATIRAAEAMMLAGRKKEALSTLERLVEADPANSEARYHFATIAIRLGQPKQALAHLHKAIARDGDVADYHIQLGTALMELGEFDEAIVALHQALRLKPQSAEALCNLGCIYTRQSKLGDAIDCLQQAIAIKPSFAVAHQNLGAALFRQGRINEALANFSAAIHHDPELAESYASLVKCINYIPDVNYALVAEASYRWSALLKRPPSRPPFANSRDPERKLRIGYVSADLRNHPVSFFLESVLTAHDRSKVEITCYSNNEQDDATTRRLEGLSDRWRRITAIDDDEASALVRRDAIDILIDLSGHTDGHRLPLFLQKPAPLQCTWLGYYATTGLPEIDYILCDRFIVPEGDEPLYSETPWRLPDSYVCYTLPPDRVEVGPLPALRNGHVTFGTFNNVLKVNRQVVQVWAELLRRVPNSRLRLRSHPLSNASVRAELQRQFEAEGIPAERIELHPGGPRREILAAYNEIDIALDPFPYGGGTTTIEALWMGAPVVSLRGDRFSGRVSESMLNAIGLPGLVLDDIELYLAKACELAADLPRLALVRGALRELVERSPLCDAPRFAQALEAAFRQMWRSWCAKKEI
jgi:predicted O-linked N-acetylglucosamine transferase (SPINDLY family)